MNANNIGRIGALAVALGIGVGLAAAPWAASAEPSDPGSSPSAGSPSAGSPSAGSPSAGSPSPSSVGGSSSATGEVAEGSAAPAVEASEPAAESTVPAAVREAADTTEPVPVPDAVAKPTVPQAAVAAKGPNATPGKRQRSSKIPTGVAPTGANARSAAVGAAASRPQTAQAAGTPAGDAPDQHTAQQQPAATTVSGSSVPQIRSVVPQTMPVAATAQMTAPTTTTSPVSGVVAGTLAWAGLSPSLTDSPVAPVESPAMLAAMAGWRRQSQQALVGDTPNNGADLPQTSQTVDPMVTGDLNATGDQGDRQALADTSTMQLSAPVSVDVASAATPAPSAFAQIAAARTKPPPGFTPTTLVSGLNQPTDFRFLPDGRILIAEKGGTIKVANTDGELQSTPLITLPTDSTGTRGLLGIAVDPNYGGPGNNYVYAVRTLPTDAAGNTYEVLSRITVTETRRLGSSPQTPPLRTYLCKETSRVPPTISAVGSLSALTASSTWQWATTSAAARSTTAMHKSYQHIRQGSAP